MLVERPGACLQPGARGRGVAGCVGWAERTLAEVQIPEIDVPELVELRADHDDARHAAWGPGRRGSDARGASQA